MSSGKILEVVNSTPEWDSPTDKNWYLIAFSNDTYVRLPWDINVEVICPAEGCTEEVEFHSRSDRYFHTLGTPNQQCWVKMMLGKIKENTP